MEFHANSFQFNMLHNVPFDIAYPLIGNLAQLLPFLHPARAFAFSSGEEKVNRNTRQLEDR
jgi:hypothetical protein